MRNGYPSLLLLYPASLARCGHFSDFRSLDRASSHGPCVHGNRFLQAAELSAAIVSSNLLSTGAPFHLPWSSSILIVSQTPLSSL